MEFRIADTFTASLAKLTNQEQKAVKTTAFDLQVDPSKPGLSYHKLDRTKDPNFSCDCQAECAKCKYTNHLKGDRNWGGWNLEGRNRVHALAKEIEAGRQKPGVKAMENDMLATLQHDYGH